MDFIRHIIDGNLTEAKECIYAHLDAIVASRLEEAKIYVAEDRFETYDDDIQLVSEAVPRRNPNIIKMGRVKKIRRRIRRNAKGRIVIQKNARRSAIKGYRISGNTVKRIPAVERLRKARLLKRSWKTTRRAKLRRTLMKRKLSMRRRKSIGLR
jgi:hypothetical protein